MANDIEDVFGSGDAVEGAASSETKSDSAAPAAKTGGTTKRKASAKKATAAKKVSTTKIILQKNDEIPPSGLFIGHNGVGYMLKPGVPVDVPDFLLDVLDNAVVSKPVLGEDGKIARMEDSPRFPYQVVREK